MPIYIPPTLTDVSTAFDAYDQGKMSFGDLLLVEQEFYLTDAAASLNTYAKKIGRGRFHGLHPIYARAQYTSRGAPISKKYQRPLPNLAAGPGN